MAEGPGREERSGLSRRMDAVETTQEKRSILREMVSKQTRKQNYFGLTCFNIINKQKIKKKDLALPQQMHEHKIVLW